MIDNNRQNKLHWELEIEAEDITYFVCGGEDEERKTGKTLSPQNDVRERGGGVHDERCGYGEKGMVSRVHTVGK